MKSERTKSELITNVSHDLKTPLTAIITYVNLLKQENVTAEERKSYVRVLDQKSMRLKALIEDLFEVSKASSGTVSLHQEDVDIVSLLKQVRFELSDKIEASGMSSATICLRRKSFFIWTARRPTVYLKTCW